MFWSKKKKEKAVNYRELASSIKGEANRLLSPFLSSVEAIMLNRLIRYMDVFLTKCIKDNKLIHKHWITARLIETDLILRTSRNRDIKNLLTEINLLQYLIMAGDKEDDVKRNKNSGND